MAIKLNRAFTFAVKDEMAGNHRNDGGEFPASFPNQGVLRHLVVFFFM